MSIAKTNPVGYNENKRADHRLDWSTVIFSIDTATDVVTIHNPNPPPGTPNAGELILQLQRRGLWPSLPLSVSPRRED